MRILLIFLTALFLAHLPLQAQNQDFNIPIFAYHRFGDDRYPSTNTSTKVFEEQLKYLKQNNFTVLSLGKAVKAWKNGDDLPEHAVIITIDDGYLSFYKNGWPLLKKYGFTATNFIQTETVGGNDFMDWQQIKEIQKAGIEIGNHSDAHPHFLNMPAGERKADFTRDLEKANAAFEKHLGETPVLYAYPYGEFTHELEDVLKDHGFEGAVVQISGVFDENSNAFAIPRFPMGGPFGTLDGFRNKSEMKALEVSGTEPQSPFYTENPPTLKVEIVPGKVDIEKAQFFVKGDKMKISKISTNSNPPYVILKSEKKLTGRRTHYTLTAPSTDGKTWHWYSYLWVNPEAEE